MIRHLTKETGTAGRRKKRNGSFESFMNIDGRSWTLIGIRLCHWRVARQLSTSFNILSWGTGNLKEKIVFSRGDQRIWVFSSYIYVEEAAEFLQKLSANESREADSKIRRRATIHTTFWAETGYAYWRHWALFWCCVNLSAWHVDADVRPRVRLCPPGTQNRLIFFSLFLPPHTKQDQYTAYFFLPTCLSYIVGYACYLWNWKWTCVSSKPIWTNQPCGKLPLNVFDNEKKNTKFRAFSSFFSHDV